MHVIKRKPFDDLAVRFPMDREPILRTYRLLDSEKCKPSNSQELKNLFPSLDRFKYVEDWWVIDIGGNKYRTVLGINFKSGRVFVKFVGTHKEYDKFTNEYR